MHNGYFDDDLEFVQLERVQIVSSMAPASTLGRHPLATRLTANLRVCAISYPTMEELIEVYSLMVGAALTKLMKVSRRSHPLCPRRPKSVTSDLWRQVWPLHGCPFGKPELAAGGNCSGLYKLQLAWLEAALPWCAAGHGRSVLAAACLAVSRFLATAGLFDGTQLHCTPARKDIPRRPSNLTFVAVPKLKRNTSRRPPSALTRAWSPWAEGGVVRREGDEIRLVAVLAGPLSTASI